MTMKTKLTSLLALFVLGSFSVATAQGYDDDDIYYNPSKAKTSAQKIEPSKTTSGYNYSYSYDVPAADSYTPAASSGINMDVDTYNRRGAFSTTASDSTKQSATESFEYTQQIERFYNPRVVIESPDNDLARVYYAEPATDINIYVNTPSYWGSSYYSPWYWTTPRSWWYYNNWAYNPWSWSWSPSWSWGWGGYYPGYYPGGWSWGPAFIPSRPHYANRPSGNSRPAYRPGQSAARYNGSAYGNSRPGYRPAAGAQGTSRPSSASPSYRPGQSATSGGNSGYRTGSSRNSNTPSYNRSSGNSTRGSSTPSYRSGSSGTSRGGSFGGGGSRGGGGGGYRGGRH